MEFVRAILVAAVIIAAAQIVSIQDNAGPVNNTGLYEGKVLQDDLTILGAAKFYSGPANGSTTLSLGERVYWFDENGVTTKPIKYWIAPGHNYETGQRLDRLPEGSMPVHLFFAANSLFKGGNDLPPLFYCFVVS